ncbi:DMT family transporter [Saccharopolyspora rosea]|uniref:DMT family transporter n=1 Tax=Saccharopolyspora rosea TaxID=524884 RepID=A0ABW3FYZ3_9PSEU|nr:EamA family transporter [Saccharopolyspora rosea]
MLEKTSSLRGFAAGPLPVLLAAALWGTTGTAATFAPRAAGALSIGAATMGLGGLLLFALAGRSAWRVLRTAPVGMFACGAASVVVYPLSFYSSMSAAGVAVGTVVTLGSAPVFAALAERVLDGVPLDRRWAVAAAVSILGGFLLVTGQKPVDGGNGAVVGALLGLLAGAAYVGYSWVAGRLMRDGHGSRAVMGAVFGAGALGLLPVLLVTGGPLLGSPSGLVVAGYLAVVPMGLAYVLFGTGLRRTPASVATTLSLLEPVVAALLSVLVVGERLGPQAWCGVALVGAGLVLVALRR